MVGEALQLAEADLVLLDAALFDYGFRLLYRVVVVRSDQHHVIFFEVVQHVFHTEVVVGVGCLDGIANWGLHSLVGCQGSLFIHVGASDQLNAEVVAEGLRASHLVLNHLTHSLEIALEAIEDDDLVTQVVSVGGLLGERLDLILKEGLLGIDVQLAVSLICEVQNLVDTLSEVIKYLHVFLKERRLADTQSNLFKNCFNLVGLWLQLEEVAIRESIDSIQALLVAFNLVNFELIK